MQHVRNTSANSTKTSYKMNICYYLLRLQTFINTKYRQVAICFKTTPHTGNKLIHAVIVYARISNFSSAQLSFYLLVRNDNLMIILGIVGQCPVEQLSLPRHLGIALSADLPSLQTNSTHSGAPAPPYLRTFILQPPEIMFILNPSSKIYFSKSFQNVLWLPTNITYSTTAMFAESPNTKESRKHLLLKKESKVT